MPNFEHLTWRRTDKVVMVIVLALYLLVLSIYSWIWGITGFLMLGVFIFITHKNDKKMKRDWEAYVTQLVHRVDDASEGVLSDLPIGIILYDEDFRISWHNPFLLSLLNKDHVQTGHTLASVIPSLKEWLKIEGQEGMNETTIQYKERFFHVIKGTENRRLYLFDRTDYDQLKLKYDREKIVLIYVHLDNLDEVSKDSDEQELTLLLGEVTSSISQWAQKRGILLKRINKDKFFGLTDQETLAKLEAEKFDIIDFVRELTHHSKYPVTLSIGVGAGANYLLELAELAQSCLSITLGRGGDQAAIKRDTGNITFYGGKSNAMEKRTRVRARVISHALGHIIESSDQVFIMGHKTPDMDSIGAAIGVLKVVKAFNKTGYIVFNKAEELTAVKRLMSEIKKDKELKLDFISPQKALELKTDKSSLIIVDTHKPSMVVEPKLISHLSRRVVIDHHRRGEDFIPDPLLVYMEPYASSTSELVTELLDYQIHPVKLSTLEATALLAGIYIDTNGFAMHTGSRTFDAASYLRSNGADSTLVQKLLKEDHKDFIKRTQIVSKADIYKEQIAIAVANKDEQIHPVSLAQAADTLLSLNGINASFVLYEREDGLITINARSLGEINVQVIMEKMHGGGHLTHAATQLDGMAIQDALKWLQNELDPLLEGE